MTLLLLASDPAPPCERAAAFCDDVPPMRRPEGSRTWYANVLHVHVHAYMYMYMYMYITP